MGNKDEMTLEKQSLKDKLSAIILLEISKPYEKMDSDLVDECVDFLMELEGKERLSKSEIRQRINDIPFKGKVTALNSHVKKKIRAKRLAIVAAVFALIIAVLSLVSLASEDTFGDLLYKMGYSLMELMDDSTVEFNGVTMYKYDETRTYQTVEELVEAEKLDILYPAWLPENVKVSQVMYMSEGETERYGMLCENSAHSVSVYPNGMIDEEIKRECLLKEINGYEVYYFVEGDFVQGSFIYKNNLYAVVTDTEENLFKIISNLKEIN